MREDDRKKKPHLEITKMGYTDLKFNSLSFGWLALPNLCIFNEVEGDGKNTVNYMQVFCPISQDAKHVFIRHMIFLVIYMYVFTFWTLPHHYRHWQKNK